MESKLLSIPLFKGIGSDELELILKKIIYQRKIYLTGALIASQNETCDRLLILISGAVKGEMLAANGRNLKIEDMYAPTVLAPAFIFGNNNVFPVNVIATSRSEVLIISKSDLLRLFVFNEKVLQNFLSMISSRAQFLSEKLRFHSFKSLKAKIAFYFLQETGDKQKFQLRHTQNELAELFGVARPSVGRVFYHLQEEQIVDIRYRQVTILNFDKLIEACSDS